MATARIVEELFVTGPTRIGLLADVSQRLGAAGIAIHAIGAYDKEGRGEFMLVTGDNTTAAAELAELGLTVERNDVVMITLADHAGALAEVARLLGDAGVNVDWIYATAGGGDHANVVLKAEDPQRVVRVLG